MTDDSHATVRRIDWRSVFPASQLFRSFRIAIHPAKLALALMAILLIYCAGRAIDGIWPQRYSAVPEEISIYENAAGRGDFWRNVDAKRSLLEVERASVVDRLQADPTVGGTLKDDASLDEIGDALKARRDRLAQTFRDNYEQLETKSDEAAIRRDQAIRATYADAAGEYDRAQLSRGRGVFATFMDYEIEQVDNVAKGVLDFNWTGPTGVFASVQRFVFTGPGWALTRHPVHAILITLVALFVWSIFGGALARLTAVHVARNEKISVRQSLRFSTNKLLSFFAAPVMPLLIVAIIWLVLAVVGVLTQIPYLGGALGVVLAAGFVVVLFVGVLLACSLIGTVAGFGLMYPTIAVEGSDAFDAVSRSFSYVFARPWKVLCYSLLGLIYAAVTYVVLRLVIYLTLALLHGGLTAWTSHNGMPDGTTSFGHAWPAPAGPFELITPVDYFSLTTAEKITAAILSFWLYLFVSLLAAYLLSFFVAVSTTMYYLLRYDVDATQIDDVYLDPEDEDAVDEFDDSLPDPVTSEQAAAEKREAAAESSATPATPSTGGSVPTDTPRATLGDATGPAGAAKGATAGEARADADAPSMPLVTPPGEATHDDGHAHPGETPKPALDGDAPERQNPT